MFTIQQLFLAASIILEILAYLFYIKAIFAGKAKPHRTTRIVLLILSTLATASLIAQGNLVAVWLAGVFAFFSLIIFLLSVRYGMGGWDKIDIISLVIALIGITIWKVTNNPSLALYSVVIADFTGMVPTLLKTYHQPRTEVWYFFFLAALGALLNLMAVQTWTLQQYAYPLYIFLINVVMVGLTMKHKFN